MSDSPPPIPSDAPRSNNAPSQPGPTSNREAAAAYNIIADKIGGLPNVRKKDNIYQAAAIGALTVIGAIVGWFVGAGHGAGQFGALLGTVGGLIVGVLLSGTVLMVIGLLRKP